jgi:hypothetical protein
MKLTLKDRVLILNNVLPMYDNRKNIGLKISISGKVQLLDSERKEVVMTLLVTGNTRSRSRPWTHDRGQVL